MTVRRGAFKSQNANEWLQELLNEWENQGNDLKDLFVVCDNAPCHSHLDKVAVLSNVPLLKLRPYSPAIETIWSSIKSTVKDNLRTPVVEGQNVGEQRITYLTENVNNAVSIICA